MKLVLLKRLKLTYRKLHGDFQVNRSKRLWVVAISLVLIAVGFQAGRRSVMVSRETAAAQGTTSKKATSESLERLSRPDALDNRKVIIRHIAGVPFSEVYEILRSASHEQIMAWARDLELMPPGPRRQAALVGFYRSLIQVDPQAGADAVIQTKDYNTRRLAIYSMTRAAPESAWGELAAMAIALPHRKGRTELGDIIGEWSSVDPVAVVKFLERNPDEAKVCYLEDLLLRWGQIDPPAALASLEAHSTWQVSEAISSLLLGWDEKDPAAAIEYAVTNARRPSFQDGIKDLAYDLFRHAPEEGQSFIKSLPAEQARAALQLITRNTTGVFMGVSDDFQRPPDVAAKWMAALPADLWKDQIGIIIHQWHSTDPSGVTLWLSQLPPEKSDMAKAAFCESGGVADFAQVVAQGLTISDAKLRREAFGEFGADLGEDRETVLQKLQQLTLSPRDKAYLRALLTKKAQDSDEP